MLASAPVTICITIYTYLVSDVDEEDENDDDKQVVNESNESNNAVNDFECRISGI